jgi:putative inorganic carbon (HCO3(-)) transporter
MTSMRQLRAFRLFGKKATPDAGSSTAVNGPGWTREWTYFVFIMLTWGFAPLVRRLVDWHNGFFNPVQISSLLPYLATIPLALIVFRRDRVARLTPAFKMFAWVWLGAFAYAFLIALVSGSIFAAAYEAQQYLVPMLIGLWLAGVDVDQKTLMKRLSFILLTLAGVIAIYGLAQFVAPAPWDVLWIEGGQYTSMGAAVPFGLRIFSTLNSAGPAADFFALSIVFALPFCRIQTIWVWALMTLIGGALLVTLVRASWIAGICGVVVYLFASPRRFQTLPFVILYAFILSVLVAGLPALLGAGQDSDVITARINTLNDVSHDNSALARTGEIQNSIIQGIEYPIGIGLGNIGSSSFISSNADALTNNVLDSGYLARFLELGWLGFAGYIFVIFGSFGSMITSLVRAKTRKDQVISREAIVSVATALAMSAALIWEDAAGDAHLGLDGVYFWIALGMGLRNLAPAKVAVVEVTARFRRADRPKSEALVVR